MANSKALKQEILFPPLLNLSENRLHIDSSFQNFEEQNSPFLNSMIQPIWTKNTGAKKVYDSTGNGYYIENGHLKDDSGKFNVAIDDSHFESVNMDRDSLQAIDIETVGTDVVEATIENNILQYGENTYDPSISGAIITCRVRIINGEAFFVIVYDDGTDEKVAIYKMESDGTVTTLYNGSITWRIWNINTRTWTTKASADLNVCPVISIGKSGNYWAFSLVTKGFEVIPSYDNYFATYIYTGSGSAFEFNNVDTSSTSTESQTATDALSVTTSEGSVTSVTKTLIKRSNNEIYYYSSSAVNYRQCASTSMFPAAVLTSANQIGTVTLGTYALNNTDATTWTYETFTVHEVTMYKRTFSISLKGSANMKYSITAGNATSSIYSNNAYYNPISNTTVTTNTGTAVTVASAASTYGSSKVGFTVVCYDVQSVPQYKWQSITFKVYKPSNDGVSQTELHTGTIPYSSFNTKTPYTINYSLGSFTSYSMIVPPCVVLDDGKMVPFFKFTADTNTTNSGSWPDACKANGTIPLYGTIYSVDTNDNNLVAFTVDLSTNPSSQSLEIPRSNSFVFGQNFGMVTAKFCNALAQTANKLADGGSENNGSEFGEFCYSNDGGLRWAPGTTRLTTKNYFAKAAYGDPTLGGNAEDAMIYTVGGHRVPVTGSNYHILYNVTTGGYAYVQGVSYTTVSNQIGTLITPWQSIKEGSYIAATGDTLIYQDKSGKWLKVTLETGAELRAILDDRCIVINTPSFYNMIDSENGKLYHYATDYNGRIQYGSNSFTQFVGVLKTSSSGYTAYSYIRYTGDAINPMYKVMPKEIVTSQIRPIVPRYRVAVGQEVAINSSVPDNNAQPIDIFYSDQNSTVCNYKYSLKNGKFISRSILEGLNYPGSSSSAIYLVPSLLADYVNGAGNNDFVIENYDAYILTFYDNKPVLNYSASTQVSSFYDEKSHFFVIQGQTYGIMNHKLYSLLYSSGSISQMDCIIDLGSMVYLGNTPMCAFFFEPSSKVIKGFSGDANLTTLLGASKFSVMG